MSISISWVLLFHKMLKISSVDISTAKKLSGLVGCVQ